MSDKIPILPEGVIWQPLNEWQKCPICEGKGIIHEVTQTTAITSTIYCNLCKGKMIISRMTGRPPEDEYKGPTGILSCKEPITEARRKQFEKYSKRSLWQKVKSLDICDLWKQ